MVFVIPVFLPSLPKSYGALPYFGFFKSAKRDRVSEVFIGGITSLNFLGETVLSFFYMYFDSAYRLFTSGDLRISP